MEGKNATNQEQFSEVAPQNYHPSPEVLSLRQALDSAHASHKQLNQQLCNKTADIHRLQIDADHSFVRMRAIDKDFLKLKQRLESREQELSKEKRQGQETIRLLERKISSLTESLQSKTEQLSNAQLLDNLKNDHMAASLVFEKQKVSEQSMEILQLKSERRTSILQETELQMKVRQLELECQQRDRENVELKRQYDDLSLRLHETIVGITETINTEVGALMRTRDLETKFNAFQEEVKSGREMSNCLCHSLSEPQHQAARIMAESLRRYKACQVKYTPVLETIPEELTETETETEQREEETFKQVEEEKNEQSKKEQDMEMTMKQLEEENNEPEKLCLKGGGRDKRDKEVKKIEKKLKKELKKKEKKRKRITKGKKKKRRRR